MTTKQHERLTEAQRKFLASLLGGPRGVALRDYRTMNACLKRGWIGQQAKSDPFALNRYLITDAGRAALKESTNG